MVHLRSESGVDSFGGTSWRYERAGGSGHALRMVERATLASESGQGTLEYLAMLLGLLVFLTWPLLLLIKLVGAIGWSWWVVGPFPIWAVIASVLACVALMILGDISKFLLGLVVPPRGAGHAPGGGDE